MDKYEQLAELANENGVIKKVLKAGANHFAVGPDFSEVGDPENYQFQDCSDIAENSKYNHKSLETTQFANGMEFGQYDVNLIFPPSGLGQLVVRCFYPNRGPKSQRFDQFKLNDEFGGWTIIAKGSGFKTPGVEYESTSRFAGRAVRYEPIREGPKELHGSIFGPSERYYWIGFHNALYLTSLYSHKEKMALKINIKPKKNVESYRGSPLQELSFILPFTIMSVTLYENSPLPLHYSPLT